MDTWKQTGKKNLGEVDMISLFSFNMDDFQIRYD